MKTFTLDGVAEYLCESDAQMADCMCDTAEDAARYPDWRGSNEARRDVFRQKAQRHIDTGEYVPGVGWLEVS